MAKIRTHFFITENQFMIKRIFALYPLSMAVYFGPSVWQFWYDISSRGPTLYISSLDMAYSVVTIPYISVLI